MKKFASLTLAVLLACALACPALAAGAGALYPAEIVESTEGGYSRLEKIYHLTAADDPADIPTADFEREGYQYTLLDLTRTDKAETDTKYYSETVTFDSSSKDMDTILPQLAATCEADTEDGYSGTLTLDTANIKVEASGYSSSSRTVSATRTYPNLSDADLSLVPKTTQESGRTLSLADVQWQEAGGYYTATASYTGTASTKYATGYTVTATYTGEVSRTTNSAATYVATFSGVPNGTRILPKEEEADTGESSGFPWVLLIPAAAGVAGLAYGGKFLYGKYKMKKEWKEYNK